MAEGGINGGTRKTLVRNQRKARNAGKAALDHVVAIGREAFQKMKQAQTFANKQETENKSTVLPLPEKKEEPQATNPAGAEPSGTKPSGTKRKVLPKPMPIKEVEANTQQKDGETAEANKPKRTPLPSPVKLIFV